MKHSFRAALVTFFIFVVVGYAVHPRATPLDPSLSVYMGQWKNEQGQSLEILPDGTASYGSDHFTFRGATVKISKNEVKLIWGFVVKKFVSDGDPREHDHRQFIALDGIRFDKVNRNSPQEQSLSSGIQSFTKKLGADLNKKAFGALIQSVQKNDIAPLYFQFSSIVKGRLQPLDLRKKFDLAFRIKNRLGDLQSGLPNEAVVSGPDKDGNLTATTSTNVSGYTLEIKGLYTLAGDHYEMIDLDLLDQLPIESAELSNLDTKKLANIQELLRWYEAELAKLDPLAKKDPSAYRKAAETLANKFSESSKILSSRAQ